MLKNLNQIVQHNIKRLSVFLVMGTVIVASTISVTALSQRVYIEDGENVTTLYSIKTEVADALKQAGVELGPDDTTEKTDNEDGTRIKVFRAFPVTVVDDEETIEVNISRGTVMDAVDKSGLTVGAEDIVSPLSSTELSNGMEINILRRYNITLIMGKEVRNLVVPAGTVREALKFLELPLGDEDSVNVDPESKVFEGMEINLTRVEYTERKEEEEVPYSKTTTMTDSLYEGERKVESGKNGTKEITLKDKIVNGEVVETRSWLVQPKENLYSYWNMQCHGIRPEDTEHSPSFPEVWKEIERLYLDEFDTFVAHNAPFDRSCLEHSAKLYHLHLPEINWQCSLKTARQVYDFGCNTLGYLCEQLGIPEGTHHRAGDDAEMCARLFLKENKDTESTIVTKI